MVFKLVRHFLSRQYYLACNYGNRVQMNHIKVTLCLVLDDLD